MTLAILVADAGLAEGFLAKISSTSTLKNDTSAGRREGHAIIFISLILSLLLVLVVAFGALWSKRAIGTAAVIGGLLSVAPLCLQVFSIAVILHALAVVVVATVWQHRGWRFRYLLLLLLGATVATYAGVGAVEYLEVRRMLNAYPYESMEARVPAPRQQWRGNSPRLEWLESEIDRDDRKSRLSRAWALEKLHEETTSVFISRPGFGVARMTSIGEGDLKLAEYDDVMVPQPGERTTPYLPEGYSDQLSPTTRDQIGWEVEGMHEDGLLDFVGFRHIGYVKDRGHVAGFRSHHFTRQPRAVKSWRLQTLDLVGLLLHEEPVVYVSNNLPRMDELREAPTRPLDPFEVQGLVAIGRGEDLFLRQTPERLRMLGSLRCARQCADCHGGQRGDLLGAFSYTFTANGE